MIERRTPVAFKALMAVAAALFLTACSEQMGDLEQYVKKVKSQEGGRIEPIPEMKPFDSYVYPEPDGLRDPFEPLGFGAKVEEETEEKGPVEGPKPDRSRPQEALEEYPLDALSYVGTLQRNNSLWALIRDPDGTIHRVKPGNYMGQNYGRILSISQSELTLRELIPKAEGGWIKKETTVAIRDGES